VTLYEKAQVSLDVSQRSPEVVRDYGSKLGELFVGPLQSLHESGDFFLRPPVLGFQVRLLEAAGKNRLHILRVQGLDHVVVGPSPQRRNGRFQRREPGHHEADQVRLPLSQPVQQLDSIGAAQADVHQGHLGAELLQHCQRLLRAGRRPADVAQHHQYFL